ncbi:MAG: hypothetical protein Q9M40_13830 [Sulfurimonas sp.]|nr:hypothetical protein [Sulfurimonas sp.]
MTIKTKVLSAVFGLLLLLSTIITFIAVNKSSDALLQSNMDKLSAVEVSKKW